MSLRKVLSRYQSLAAGISAVVIVITIILVGRAFLSDSSADRELQAMTFFYDLNTCQLFEVPVGTEPPLETESGPHEGMPAGVRAYVFSCGPYQGGDDYFIGILEAPVASLPESQRPPGAAYNPETGEGGLAVRRPDDDRWMGADTLDGQRILDELIERCRQQGGSLTVVRPLAK